MIPRLLYFALFAFAAFPTVIWAQPAGITGGNNRTADHRGEILADAAEATRQEALKSHPEQMRVQLRLLAGQFHAAGLTEEVQVIQALEQRIKDEHFQALLDAHRRALANAFEPAFSLKIQIAELRETEATIAELNELVGARNPSNQGAISGVLESDRVSEWVEKQKELGQLHVHSEEQITLLNGRATVMKRGTNVDAQTLSKPRPSTRKGSTQESVETEFIGTSVRAILKLMPEGVIQFSTVTEISSVTPASNNSRAGIGRKRIQTVMELQEGQTLLLSGLPSTGSIAEISRIPVLGDIPVVGPRLFSSKKMMQESNRLIFVATPQIVRRTDDAHHIRDLERIDAVQPASLSRPAK